MINNKQLSKILHTLLVIVLVIVLCSLCILSITVLIYYISRFALKNMYNSKITNIQNIKNINNIKEHFTVTSTTPSSTLKPITTKPLDIFTCTMNLNNTDPKYLNNYMMFDGKTITSGPCRYGTLKMNMAIKYKTNKDCNP